MEEKAIDRPMTFVATGDSFITRRLPSRDADSFVGVSNLIRQADVRFTNLEVTLESAEGTPSALSGGTWAVASPDVLQDIQAYGFNMIAWANNHTLDYLYSGLQATARYLDRYGFLHAGVGHNLAEASAVKYLETVAGRVAIIAATSTFHEFWLAGEQRPDMKGRPGINSLRYQATHTLSAPRLEQLKAIAETVGINAKKNLARLEGFSPASDSNVFEFGDYRFMAGEKEGRSTVPHEGDLLRMLARIEEAKGQADYVLVSIHAHEMDGEAKEKPAEFLKTFARRCIDQGAHAVIGHGPHIVRGIELYKNRPIFYSLGNFIFQNDTVSRLPADFYEKYGMGHYDHISAVLDKRSNHDTKGLGADPRVWSSVIPYWTMHNGELTELVLHPIQIGYGQPRHRRGWPELTERVDILEELQRLSAPFGTIIDIVGNEGRVRIPH
ncbi:hypothetical protein J31TS4_19790 [Paenibacillus sp. J31TS4]|uniref:CapA family protein n=1 Tax=Paenibacillus sp. J31TS4 TaxID=2807195 RepID=UPI001B020526|nr:CapA family protein [Paenibacillus sp. J31TS4]GIP38699.1 hypothetical protein J31TS4_19790 [Paenibacillus sp. J31TS4]